MNPWPKEYAGATPLLPAMIRRDSQVASSHLGGLRDAGNGQQSWSDVAQGAALAQADGVAIGRNQQEGNRVGGVVGVRAAGYRINHQLGVAMVGGDDHSAARALQRRVDAA